MGMAVRNHPEIKYNFRCLLSLTFCTAKPPQPTVEWIRWLLFLPSSLLYPGLVALDVVRFSSIAWPFRTHLVSCQPVLEYETWRWCSHCLLVLSVQAMFPEGWPQAGPFDSLDFSLLPYKMLLVLLMLFRWGSVLEIYRITSFDILGFCWKNFLRYPTSRVNWRVVGTQLTEEGNRGSIWTYRKYSE